MAGLGLTRTKTRGSHEQYEGVIGGINRKVTVDVGKSPFDDFLLKNMIRQAGVTRERFYGASRSALRKI